VVWYHSTDSCAAHTLDSLLLLAVRGEISEHLDRCTVIHIQRDLQLRLHSESIKVIAFASVITAITVIYLLINLAVQISANNYSVKFSCIISHNVV